MAQIAHLVKWAIADDEDVSRGDVNVPPKGWYHVLAERSSKPSATQQEQHKTTDTHRHRNSAPEHLSPLTSIRFISMIPRPQLLQPRPPADQALCIVPLGLFVFRRVALCCDAGDRCLGALNLAHLYPLCGALTRCAPFCRADLVQFQASFLSFSRASIPLIRARRNLQSAIALEPYATI